MAENISHQPPGLEDSLLNSEEELEEEEEIEPKFKYEQLGNEVLKYLSNDAASCLAVHSKFMALGTHWGKIYLIDLMGFPIPRQLADHSMSVNQISIDDNGDYLASCSDDGRVIINGLYSNDNNQFIQIDGPVKSIAIDPVFSKAGSGKHFVHGTDKLTLHEKGILNRHKSMVLHQGEGPIRNIKWNGPFIAWSNDLGVKIYDMSVRKRITFIKRDNMTAKPEINKCALCWKGESQLMIGWANVIKVCVVKEAPGRDRDQPNRYVELLQIINIDAMICGLAPIDDCLAVLTYNEEEHEGGRKTPGRPTIRIINATDNPGDELCNDVLSVKGYQQYLCNDYHLEWSMEQAMYLIVSPKQIIIAKQRDLDDHVAWLIKQEKFEEALEVTKQNSKQLKHQTYEDIGIKFVDHLLESENYVKLEQWIVRVLGKNKELWEHYIPILINCNAIAECYKHIPTRHPVLEQSLYDRILNHFMASNLAIFFELIETWPSQLYNLAKVVAVILDQLDRDRNNSMLLEALALLYTYDQRYDKALYLYLTLKRSNVFELIQQHNLFDAVADRVLSLMEFNATAAVQLLLDNRDKVPIGKVVQQLEKYPKFLHAYLSQMFIKDPHLGAEFQPMLIDLLAEFDPPRLIFFLRTSSHYSLTSALETCTQRGLSKEMIFLLGRMGNAKQALELIITELKDVPYAIEFCKEYNEAYLWDELIKHAINKPEFIIGLLNSVGAHIDPTRLIEKIEVGMKIPGLRNSLVKIIHDYTTQITLREGCKKILISDCFLLLKKQIKHQKRGVRVDAKQVCQSCHERIMVSNLQRVNRAVVFYCHHIFHEDCVMSFTEGGCPICATQGKRPEFGREISN